MAGRISNLSHRQCILLFSRHGILGRRRFLASFLSQCVVISAILGPRLAAIFIMSAGPTLAWTTVTTLTPSTRTAESWNTVYRSAGLRITRNFQQTPQTNETNRRSATTGKTTRTRVAGPCLDKGKRYVDCADGTVIDTVTGLIWLKNSSCLGTAEWETAKRAAAALKNGDCMLTDGSSPGDWRLPTRAEWEDTMKNALALRCTGPTLTNDDGTACISTGPSVFTGVESDYYWSSTLMEGNGHAWFGDLDHGHLLNGNLINTLHVWPVRGVER